jgi:hypothetical protein
MALLTTVYQYQVRLDAAVGREHDGAIAQAPARKVDSLGNVHFAVHGVLPDLVSVSYHHAAKYR